MKLLKFLLLNTGRLIWLPIIAGIVSGVCNSALLIFINFTLSNSNYPPSTVIRWYIGFCLLLLFSTFCSQFLLVALAQRTMFDLRMRLTRKILNAPLRRLEEAGPSALFSVLANDTTVVAQAFVSVPHLCINMATMLTCLIYIGWLSTTLICGLLFFVILGGISYWLIVRRAYSYQKVARRLFESLLTHFRALSDGNKELKLSYLRRSNFYQKDLLACATELQRLNSHTSSVYIVADIWSRFIYFFLIGLIIFALPLLIPLTAQVLMGYVLVILYLMGPVGVFTNSLPNFSQAQVSLRRMEEIGLSLDSERAEDNLFTTPSSKAKWQRLEFEDVTHTYYHEEEDSAFTLGPINLKFHPGELVFLVGGNGSGKSTFAKVITGLYIPESGQIRLDGEAIDHENRDAYRQLFSAVFSDFYLFERLPTADGADFETQGQEYLRQLQLAHKVRVENGKLSTTALSGGQRKRLALLASYIEDRPFYVFDEWASDQDPLFKNIFYTQILPELRSRGKTVLVITHDDAYYHLADRLIKLDYGRCVIETDPDALNYHATSLTGNAL
jgi:putative ATP-binding cassette transporter